MAVVSEDYSIQLVQKMGIYCIFCTLNIVKEIPLKEWCSPRWRRGSGLDFGSDDPGSIPCLPSPRVGPLMARR